MPSRPDIHTYTHRLRGQKQFQETRYMPGLIITNHIVHIKLLDVFMCMYMYIHNYTIHCSLGHVHTYIAVNCVLATYCKLL